MTTGCSPEVWKEFLRKLQRDFPKFHNKNPRCFSEVGVGWFDLVYKASERIENLINSEQDATPSQIKEKFGGLRFYVDLGKDPFLKREIKEILDKAEKDSLSICEMCGKPGSKVQPSGRIKTLCEIHKT